MIALLATAIAVGIRQPDRRVLPALGGEAPRYADDPLPPIAGVSQAFAKHVLGAAAYASVAPTATVLRKPQRPGPTTRPGSRTFADTPGLTAQNGLFGDSGKWELHLAFVPERTEVHPSDHVKYAILVGNSGKAPFAGTVSLQWHVPINTVSTPQCPLDVPIVCPFIAPLFIEPGTGVDGRLGIHLHFHNGPATIRPGETYTYVVELVVNDVVPPGTVLQNHAHLQVQGSGNNKITADAAPVRVV
jgi:hypothetical protein